MNQNGEKRRALSARPSFTTPAGGGIAGEELDFFGDRHTVGERLDYGPGELAMAAEGHDVAELALAGPAADRLLCDMKQGGSLRSTEVGTTAVGSGCTNGAVSGRLRNGHSC